MSHLLDINDLGIGLIGPDSIHRSPGFAAMEGKTLVFGDKARAICRLNPGQTANQFWRDLSPRKSSANFPSIRHQADLAWKHLHSFNNSALRSTSLIAVPSHYSKEQISLLSGILQSLGVRDSLICNRALLMASLYPEFAYHLDFQLHQLVITKIENSGSELSCGELIEYPGLGLLGLCEVLLKGVQASFIDKTRFDPLHHALTEQQLFNQLMQVVLDNQWGRVELKIAYKDIATAIELSEKQLLGAADDYLQRITSVLPKEGFVTDALFAALPIDVPSGRVSYVDEQQFANALTEILDSVAAPSDFLELQALSCALASGTREGAKDFSVAIPEIPEVKPQPPASDKARSTHTSTHLLSRGVAVPGEGKFFVQEGSRFRLSQPGDDRLQSLGDCIQSAEGLVIRSDSRHLRINGKPFAVRHILHADDVVSHDELAGSIVAIEVAT